jgi:hypothetical protein
MSLLFLTAFGLQTSTFGIEWNSTTGSPTVETTISRSNGTALRFAGTGSKAIQWNTYAPAQGVRFYRVYFHIVAAPSANQDFVVLQNASNGKVLLRLTSALALSLYNAEDNAQIGSDYTLSTATWYRVEIKVDSTTLASTTVEARLYDASDESTLLWNPSGTENFATDPNRFGIAHSGNATFDFVVTDIVANDNSGSVLNDWMGEGSLVYLRPSGAGSNTQWARAGTDSGANWSQVDESPPNDITDYVQSNTSGEIDDYALSNTPAAVGASDVIDFVLVGVRHSISSTTGADPDFKVRLTAGGNTNLSANIAPASSATWATNTNNNTYVPPLVLTDMPGASTTAWTKSDLDAAEVGIEQTFTDTHFARITAIWVIAHHHTAGAVPTNIDPADIVTGSPVISAPVLTTVANIDPADIVTGSPVLSAPVLSTVVNLVPGDITAGTPAIDAPTLTTAASLVPGDIVAGSPVLDAPVVTVVVNLVVGNIVAGSPVISAPVVTVDSEEVNLVVGNIVAGSPVISAPVLSTVVNLVTGDIVTGSPVISAPVLTTVINLDPADIVAGSPTIGSPVLSTAANLVPASIVAGSPVISAPVLTTVASLVVSDLTAGSPILESPVLTTVVSIVPADIVAGTPVIGSVVLFIGVVVPVVSITFPSTNRSSMEYNSERRITFAPTSRRIRFPAEEN